MNLIILIIQGNLTYKTQQESIYKNLLKKIDLASLKSKIDKLDIDKIENVSNGLGSFKGKTDKLDVDRLTRVPLDFLKK